jgi:hypothetical protein
MVMCGLSMNGKTMKNKTGRVKISMVDLDGVSFTDMAFFQEKIPVNCEIIDIVFYHDFSYDDYPDDSAIIINWRKND